MTLSQRLFWRILPTLMATILIVGALAYRSATREIENIYDAELINDANTLWILLKGHLEKNDFSVPAEVPDIDFSMGNQLALNQDADDYADAHAFRSWKADALAMVSSNAFPASVPKFGAGFADYTFAREKWRVYSLPIAQTGIVVEVAEKIALRKGLVGNILLDIALPLLVLVPAIAFLTWLVINNGLSHIRGLVRQIRSRTPDDLSTLAINNMPSDLLPLVRSLNQFMQKLDTSLTLERRFADLAAHQLRTPQAGIKLLLQMLEKATDEDERQQLMKDLVASNERAMHLIAQLLHLARVSHQPLRLEAINLYEVAAASLADVGAILGNRGFEVELAGSEVASVNADRLLLRLLIDNLVDNAIKYSPDGGEIRVEIAPAGAYWRLVIDDRGPGIPEDQRKAVFLQFHRVSASDRDGAGLGLAIVAEIAKRLGIQVGLSTPTWGYGLRVELIMPAVAA
ncbi:sensor histidine kinase [Pleomorphomonas sp. PLEO]|uniref:sensor histidine kinase n=1 Tax=Pleomorphomonas sp. PLEO TaxID=3239306 RepID=UPI00351E3ECF